MRYAVWAAAVSTLRAGSAEAMPIPALYLDHAVTLASGGCGQAFHRNVYGACVPNGAGWGVAAPGYYGGGGGWSGGSWHGGGWHGGVVIGTAAVVDTGMAAAATAVGIMGMAEVDMGMAGVDTGMAAAITANGLAPWRRLLKEEAALHRRVGGRAGLLPGEAAKEMAPA
jgi:hypothetical protein